MPPKRKTPSQILREKARGQITNVANRTSAYINRPTGVNRTRADAVRRVESQRIAQKDAAAKEGIIERSLNRAKWARRRRQALRTLKYNREEIKKIEEELKKIMEELKKQGHPSFKFMNNDSFRRSLALSLFEKYGSNKFALNKSSSNKKIIAQMIMNIEKGAASQGILLKNNTGTNMMRIESLKRNVIEQTIEQFKNPQDPMTPPVEMKTTEIST
jgi:hypothetical protein